MRKVLLLSIVMFSFLMLILPVFAEQTVKSIDIPLGFDALSNPEEVVVYNFTIDAPDGIADVIAMEILVKADMLAGTKAKAGILIAENNTAFCDPVEWSAPTWNVDNYEMSFDCTSELPESFDWSALADFPLPFAIQFDDYAGSVKPRLKMTYYNNPRHSIQVMGTEYQINTQAKAFLQLLDENKQPITNATCFMSVYNPDNTIWINQTEMDYVNEGLYAYDLWVTNVTGVYMLSAFCSVPQMNITREWNRIVYDDLECPSNGNDYQGGWLCGDGWVMFDENGTIPNETWNLRNSQYVNVSGIDSPFNGSQHINFHSTNGHGNADVNLTGYTDVFISFWAKANSLESGDEAYFRMETGSKTGFYIDVYEWNETNDDNTYHFYNFSFSDYGVVFGDEVEVEWDMQGGSEYDDLWIDDIEIWSEDSVYTVINDTEYQFVRGSGELHVYEPPIAEVNETAIAEATWNYTERHLTQDDVTLHVSGTEYASGEEGILWNVLYKEIGGGAAVPINNATCEAYIRYPNGSVFVFNESMPYVNGTFGIYRYNFTVPETTGVYVGGVLCKDQNKEYIEIGTFHVAPWANNITGFNNLTAEEIWTYFNRTLTDGDECPSCNITEMVETVWNYSNRTLTDFNFTIDVDVTFDYEQMAQYVWNFSNRTVNLTEVIEEMRSVNSSIFTKLHLIQDDIENLNNLSAEEVWTYSNRTVNLTEILDFLYAMNASIHLRLDEIEQIILDFNASIHIEVDNLANLSASEVWSYFNRTLTDYNQSELIALLNQTQNLILNLNNLSASNVWEYPIRNLTYINFTEVLDRIDLANTTIINEILAMNASIWTKLYLIQDELAYINFTTWETNWIVKNLTLGNITLTTDINWTRLREEVWNKTSDQKLTHDVLSFADDEVQLVITTQFCIDNTTLAYNHNVSRSILGLTFEDNLEEFQVCDYGCYNNECRQPPWVIYLVAFLLMLVISALIFYFSPKDEMT